jgi:hypothetical protein
MRSLMTLALMLSFVVAACVSKPVETPAAHPEPTLAEVQENVDKLKNDDEIHWQTPGKFIDPTAQNPVPVVTKFTAEVHDLLAQIKTLEERLKNLTPEEKAEFERQYRLVHPKFMDEERHLSVGSRDADVTCLEGELQKQTGDMISTAFKPSKQLLSLDKPLKFEKDSDVRLARMRLAARKAAEVFERAGYTNKWTFGASLNPSHPPHLFLRLDDPSFKYTYEIFLPDEWRARGVRSAHHDPAHPEIMTKDETFWSDGQSGLQDFQVYNVSKNRQFEDAAQEAPSVAQQIVQMLRDNK